MKILVVLLLLVGLPTLVVVGYVGGWFLEGASVVREELGPRTILQRYEWFIEQWNAIQEQDATLSAYEASRAALKDELGDKPTASDRRELAQQSAELRGILANRNRLAREYRAAIQKINYKPATMAPHFPETIPDYKLK